MERVGEGKQQRFIDLVETMKFKHELSVDWLQK